MPRPFYLVERRPRDERLRLPDHLRRRDQVILADHKLDRHAKPREPFVHAPPIGRRRAAEEAARPLRVERIDLPIEQRERRILLFELIRESELTQAVIAAFVA